METHAVGLDFGNNAVKVCIEGLVAKVLSRIAFEKPHGQISDKTGLELKAKAFSLQFGDKEFWFGPDTLSGPAIQKLDMAKYDPDHISVLTRAALYQWSKQHKRDLATLGKLNIVASMPPGLYQDPAANKAAVAAFRKAFNRGQSHVKIRDGKSAVQIVTQFGGLQREAVAWGQSIPRKGELVLTVDLGGGTVDYALFNGSTEPLRVKTDQNGLLHAYTSIDPIDPGAAEMKVMRNKKDGLPHHLLTYYNAVERRIQMISLPLPKPIDRLYIIGGGAALMTPAIKTTFSRLSPKTIFKDEYANCRANWRKAGGE
ncbi:MAG: hypothetical protein GY743_23430 [Planctomycetaceae bacterium]|nr:hypothetical protein [Planctomycetaceae bacterium]